MANTPTPLVAIPPLTAAASLALAVVVAADGHLLGTSGWLFSALGWAGYASADAHLRRVLRKWRETIERQRSLRR
jgi:hypothetical protein